MSEYTGFMTSSLNNAINKNRIFVLLNYLKYKIKQLDNHHH